MALLQAVVHGMLFAFIYLVLQKCQVLSEGKGEALFSAKISNLLLFLSIVSFIVRLLTLGFLPVLAFSRIIFFQILFFTK